MDRFFEAQIAYTFCEMLIQISELLMQYYSEEFKEIIDDITTSMNERS